MNTIDLIDKLPSSSVVGTARHPSVASLPLRRQIVADVTAAGGLNQSGSSFRVAVIMKRAHSGTASSAA